MSPESDAVLAANEAFYRAFRDGDMAAMQGLWAADLAVTCTHPGWRPLSGRAEVIASWAAILNSPERPAIACIAPHATMFGDVAVVICYEAVGGGFLAATNLFAREAGRWRMIHHHAGPTRDGPVTAAGGDAVH
ncbi:MAG: nuclear transport factor 2 family protein [Alphaproteobacteria bacterium]